MDTTGFSVHLAECEDDSFSVLISVDGFESEEAAGEFAHLFLWTVRLLWVMLNLRQAAWS